jgi:putative endonuclease
MTYQKKIGNLGEAIASEFLQAKGYQYLEQHFTTRFGELDLVMQEGDTIVFVEVKTRTSDTFGLPEVSVTQEKIEKLQKSALLWLQANPEAPDDWRLDVVAVLLDRQKTIRDIHHFINIS